ncbi:hypothetical protein [Spirillospora sp. NPDC048819]|uniref:hypothetical protein n=1 Tax=Spirillospora sp. NPDC048819 TaxID=3155268 RepID=UPI0033FD2E30
MNDHKTRTGADIERLAGELHERVRALNRLTQREPGLSEAAGAYTVLGNLAQTSFRLAQTAEQVDEFLTKELDAGNLGHDQGDDPVAAVTVAHNSLSQAAEQAADLGDSFRRAASAIAPIYTLGPGDEPALDQHAVRSAIEREASQVEPAREDFPNPVGDVLTDPSAVQHVAPELRSPPQARHPRRER